MALSDSAKAELENEARALRQEILKISRQVAELQKARDRHMAQLEAITRLTHVRGPEGVTATALQASIFGPGPLRLSPDSQFRENIRQVLRHFQRPMRPLEVRQYLEKAGIRYLGRTDYTTRVGNELNRLAKMGQVVKSGQTYQWPDEN